MNVETYRARKAERETRLKNFGRQLCTRCLQPSFTCYCAWLKPIDPGVEFVILIHPKEFRRRIATGRLSHLSLHGSHLIVGEDFSKSVELNRILNDRDRTCLILYPGRPTVNLTPLKLEERWRIVPRAPKLTLVVIDGTWATARKMIRLSNNLKTIQRICFTPTEPSNFRIRQQPSIECVSTIEAIHHVLELFDLAPDDRGRLLEHFDRMVNRRLELAHSVPRPV